MIRQPDSRICVEGFFNQRKNFRQCLVETFARGETARKTVKGRGAFFPAPLGLFALAQLRSEMTDDDRDNEVDAEHHEIVQMTDVKSESWRDEQKIPEHRA